MKSPDRRLLRVLLAGASLVVLVAGVRAIAGLLNPVLLAGFLAFLLQPMLFRLRRFHGAAVFLIVLTVIIAGLGVVGFMVVSLRQVALELPQYQEQLQSLVQRVSDALAARGIDAVEYVRRAITGEAVAGLALGFTGWVAGSAGSLFLTLFIFAFMLGGMEDLERRARTDAGDHSPVAARFLRFSGTIRGYMGVRAALGIAAALLNYILLLVMGVNHAALWAILSFFFSFVPNIGFVLSLVPPVLLALLERGWVSAVIVFAGYQLINAVVDNVVGPKFVGRQMKISALLSFLSVLFWAWVLGPTGAILSVPLTVLIRDWAFPPTPPHGFDPPPPADPSPEVGPPPLDAGSPA